MSIYDDSINTAVIAEKAHSRRTSNQSRKPTLEGIRYIAATAAAAASAVSRSNTAPRGCLSC